MDNIGKKYTDIADMKIMLKKANILHIQNQRLIYYLQCNKNFYKAKISALESKIKNLENSIKDLQKENINIERSRDENISN